MLVPAVPSKRILLLLDASTALVSQRVDSFVLALLMVLSCRVGLGRGCSSYSPVHRSAEDRAIFVADD